MGRIHGCSPCEWTIDFDYDFGTPTPIGYGHYYPRERRYHLSLRLTYDQARALLVSSTSADRGCPLFERALGGELLNVTGIRITERESVAIRNGTNPVDVLGIDPWPECGWRLAVVPDPLC